MRMGRKMDCSGIGLLLCVLGAVVVYSPAIRLSAVKDTTLEPRTLLGSFEYLVVGKGRDFPKKRFVIQFENITSNCTQVDSAMMYLQYGYAHKAEWFSDSEEPTLTRQLCTYRILRSWDEATVGGSTYMTAGADYVPNCMDLVTLTNDSIKGQLPNGFVPFNITEAARSWVSGADNYGILVLDLNEDLDGRDRRFWSREAPAASGNRPYLEVICDGTGKGSAEVSGCSNVGRVAIPTVGALVGVSSIVAFVIAAINIILWFTETRRQMAKHKVAASKEKGDLPGPAAAQVINISVNNDLWLEKGHCEKDSADKKCNNSSLNAYNEKCGRDSTSKFNGNNAPESAYYEVM